MKVVVIGCTHAGTAAIKNLKKLNPNAKITVFERNDNISFYLVESHYMLAELSKIQKDFFILHLKNCLNLELTLE
ncbi:FAD/NAD(P)-binding oxidoreductase [Leptotrichia sp. oral taxon 218]|uniref:FAD/NAD(P)-binding oxidoreductase n=1 Tax=Leptotrichia sp. oral taxon 218 TaxID=712361 RepID=UPI00273983EB|nr:FAD/NAD(P)-binding oxidoreductase [Leptotrichia sp. oral taxon 218]